MSSLIDKIEAFVNNTNFSKESLELSQANTITNREKFAKSHLEFLKGKSSEHLKEPYLERMIKFKKLIDGGK